MRFPKRMVTLFAEIMAESPAGPFGPVWGLKGEQGVYTPWGESCQCWIADVFVSAAPSSSSGARGVYGPGRRGGVDGGHA